MSEANDIPWTRKQLQTHSGRPGRGRSIEYGVTKQNEPGQIYEVVGGRRAVTEPFSLKLSGELGLRGIDTLKSQIVAALASHDAVAIDTSAVEGVDASAVQLLLSAQKTADAEGKAMTLTASGALTRTLLALGLVAADGAPLVPETSTWTIKAAA